MSWESHEQQARRKIWQRSRFSMTHFLWNLCWIISAIAWILAHHRTQTIRSWESRSRGDIVSLGSVPSRRGWWRLPTLGTFSVDESSLMVKWDVRIKLLCQTHFGLGIKRARLPKPLGDGLQCYGRYRSVPKVSRQGRGCVSSFVCGSRLAYDDAGLLQEEWRRLGGWWHFKKSFRHSSRHLGIRQTQRRHFGNGEVRYASTLIASYLKIPTLVFLVSSNVQCMPNGEKQEVNEFPQWFRDAIRKVRLGKRYTSFGQGLVKLGNLSLLQNRHLWDSDKFQICYHTSKGYFYEAGALCEGMCKRAEQEPGIAAPELISLLTETLHWLAEINA